jgi:eukaryotic-like serine/threonine-protein kinase
MISAYRWKVLEPLIDRALDTDPAQRGAYFEAVSGGDVVLRTELEQLVDECERSDATLDGRLPELFPSLFEAEGWRPLPALDDRFRIERELGSGGMATVYLARDLRHERDVAIKVLRPQLAALLGTERFLAEVRVTANLRHPHILPLFDSGTADGQLYYVMPYVAGESLRDRLTREVQIPVTDALRIAREVAGALDAAHRQGVIHRDIKPENILLSDGQAFIADFGIALAATRAGGERITQTGVALGTPQYMSPEQAGGRLDVDARTDVCSLGAVLFEMLAGEPPFTGPTPQAIVAKMMASDPPSVRRVRPTVSGALDAVIRKALASVPGDRYASAGDLAQALERCGGEVVQR